jgi:hypothetical protein
MGSLYAKNKIYTGYDGNTIGFQASTNVTSSAFSTVVSGSFYLSYPTNLTIAGKTYRPFSGSFQELRFYDINLTENRFDDYVMNPYSIEGNQLSGPNSALESLIFRAPLGTVLDNDVTQTTRTSIHPRISTIPPIQSFNLSGSSVYTLNGIFTMPPQTEVLYQDQFAAGVKNAVTEKIKIINTVYPEGSTLSPYVSVQQISYLSESFSRDINYIEVAFSPQDEVNDDIISQLGNFNIGNYIGDPRQVPSSLTYYPNFNKLRDEYFSKYISNYNLWDYIRLIKFYDNSLFKMIKDFTPARASLATGIVIKQTILERNKYPLPQATTNSEIAWVGSPTTRTLNIPY